MKKIIMTAVVMFIMVFCMTGCGEEQDEFVDYINGGIKTELGKLESQAKDSYASVTGDNAKDNETTLKELNTNTITLTKQAVEKATSLGDSIKGEKLKKTHAIYVSSLKNFQSGVELLIQVLQNDETDKIEQVTEFMNKANEESSQYLTEIKKLAEELGVEFQSQDNSK